MASCIFVHNTTLQWRHNGRDGVSNHRPYDCLLNRLSRRRSNKTSKLRATGLCAGNSPVTGEFLAQKASNSANVSIWWRHHDTWEPQYLFVVGAKAFPAYQKSDTGVSIALSRYSIFLLVIVCLIPMSGDSWVALGRWQVTPNHTK